MGGTVSRPEVNTSDKTSEGHEQSLQGGPEHIANGEETHQHVVISRARRETDSMKTTLVPHDLLSIVSAVLEMTVDIGDLMTLLCFYIRLELLYSGQLEVA
jgi:hypothetical protein